jgi:hypothetical protein
VIGEPDVTLTDYGLTVLAAGLAVGLLRRPRPGPARPWLLAFLAATALATALGGTVHGFFPDPAGRAGRVLWAGALLAVASAAWAAWGLGAAVLWGPSRRSRRTVSLAGLGFLAYGLAVVAGWRAFTLAVAHYLPAVLFLLVAFAAAYRRARHPAALAGLVAVALILTGAVVQVRRIALHPVYFTHNALYHLMQAGALIALSRTAGLHPSPARAPGRPPAEGPPC